MSETTRILLLGAVVLITHCLEGITGFGCTVLALPFVIMLLGIKTAVPVLVILAWLLAGYIIARSWKNISWRELRFILLHVGVGLPIGILLFEYMPERGLKLILAMFMVFVGAHGFFKTKKMKERLLNGDVPQDNRKTSLMRCVLFLGGIIHGAFGTGGPFVVIYASKALRNKTLFRVTLCLLWFSLNTLLILQWAVDGSLWRNDVTGYTAWALPFLISGMLLGDYMHHKVNEYYFKLTVYAILAGSGLVMGANLARLTFDV